MVEGNMVYDKYTALFTLKFLSYLRPDHLYMKILI